MKELPPAMQQPGKPEFSFHNSLDQSSLLLLFHFANEFLMQQNHEPAAAAYSDFLTLGLQWPP